MKEGLRRWFREVYVIVSWSPSLSVAILILHTLLYERSMTAEVFVGRIILAFITAVIVGLKGLAEINSVKELVKKIDLNGP